MVIIFSEKFKLLKKVLSQMIKGGNGGTIALSFPVLTDTLARTQDRGR